VLLNLAHGGIPEALLQIGGGGIFLRGGNPGHGQYSLLCLIVKVSVSGLRVKLPSGKNADYVKKSLETTKPPDSITRPGSFGFSHSCSPALVSSFTFQNKLKSCALFILSPSISQHAKPILQPLVNRVTDVPV
jgi:hypothetical protein